MGDYQKSANRVKVDKLKGMNVASEFLAKLEENFAQVEINEVSDIETEWKGFKAAILELAKECCGMIGIKNGRKKMEWWNENAGQQRNKVFWTKVKNIRNGGTQQAPGTVLGKSGNVAIGKKNAMKR